jgi:hypothetical protein
MELQNYIKYSTKQLNCTITYFHEFESLGYTFNFELAGKVSLYLFNSNYLPLILDDCLKLYFKKLLKFNKLTKKDLALLEPNKSLYNLKVHNVLKMVLVNNILAGEKTNRNTNLQDVIRSFIQKEINNLVLEFQKTRLNYFTNLGNNIKKIKQEAKTKIQEKKDRKFEVYKLSNNKLNLDILTNINEFL